MTTAVPIIAVVQAADGCCPVAPRWTDLQIALVEPHQLSRRWSSEWVGVQRFLCQLVRSGEVGVCCTPIALAFARYASSRAVSSSRSLQRLRGRRSWASGHGAGHLLQPVQVRLKRCRRVGHRPQRVDVRHGVVGGRVDRSQRSWSTSFGAPPRAPSGLRAALGPAPRGAAACRRWAAVSTIRSRSNVDASISSGPSSRRRRRREPALSAMSLQPAAQAGLVVSAATCCLVPAGSRSTWSRIRSS